MKNVYSKNGMVISVDDECFYVSIRRVQISDDSLIVDLVDGRQISAPIVWYPRLLHGTVKERQNYEVNDWSIHWPDLDEDIHVKGMLLGRRSGESQTSLNRWLKAKKLGKLPKVPHLPLPEWAKIDLGESKSAKATPKRRSPRVK